MPAAQELRQPVAVDVAALLERYREACADAGVVPLPDDQAAAMLARVLAGDDTGLELH